MNDMKIYSNPQKSTFSGIQTFESKNHDAANHSFLKQQIHDKKVDEFFHTDLNAPHKRDSIQALIGSIVGVIIPTVLIAKKQKPELFIKQQSGQKMSFLNKAWKALDIEYDIKTMLSVGLGGVAGGLAGGLIDKKERNKLDKIEEATFQAMNISFPALLVSGAMKACAKFKPLNNIPAKIALSLASVLVGANSAVFVSNKLDDKLFDKYNKDPERKFRKKDLIVHVDDLFGTLILAKFPLADKLHINKILPAIFAWSGYHTGDL